jgi:hypothetical protein
VVAAKLPEPFPSDSLKPSVPSGVSESRVHRRLGLLIEALVRDEDIGSERELSRRTDLSNGALGKWSNLKADPRLLKLMQFAYPLGWTLTELMGFAEGDEDPQAAIARKKRERTQTATPLAS